jgi:glycosyltransferase involved in cell wall biosynthesis
MTGAVKVLHLLDLVSWWRIERRALRAADAAVALTESDRHALLGRAGATPIVTIPLGIDVPGVAADPLGTVPPTVLFVGGDQHPPNVDAAERLATEILPLILQEVSDARIVIVGRHSSAVLSRRAGQHLVLAGHVPDVRPYLEQAAVVVAPMRLGGGMRVKVLEALGAGKAVVSSSLGLAGTDVAQRGAAVVADTNEEISDAIIRLLRDERERGELAARAREWAIAELAAHRHGAQYDEVYEAIQRSGPSP